LHPTSPAGATVIASWIFVLLFVCLAAIAWRVFIARARTAQRAVSAAAPVSPFSSPTAAPEPIAFANEAIDAAIAQSFQYAFGTAHFEDRLAREDALMLERIGAAAGTSLLQRDYFPRRPMLLPKLMQALNDPETSREDLVKLILEDPAIAGGVIQQANTAFYRVSPARVDNIDRAVWLLGTDGLRRLMATAIMQPVFRLPKGYFDAFAPVTWEHAQRAAAAAESYSQGRSHCDPLIAQLLAVLEPLARIVIFRVAMEKYRESPNITPRAEVFVRAIQGHSPQVAVRIAEAWQMSEVALHAVREQAKRVAPSSMRELSRAVYYSNLAATLTLVAARDASAAPALQATLRGQGLTRMETELLWQASSAAGESV
jgi:HD-like signal output (HDOD) protein